jgi:hypothetical protein
MDVIEILSRVMVKAASKAIVQYNHQEHSDGDILCVIYTILLEKSQSNSLGQAMHRLLIIQLVFSKICCINEDLHIVSPIE